MRFDDNIILLTDSYKVGHYPQYPKGTEYVYSYFESREGSLFQDTTFFGLQYILKRYFHAPSMRQVDEAAELFRLHFGSDKLFNYEGWKYIAELGYLPVRIKAVPEGMTIPTRNVLMTIENTDPKCFWLTNYLETLLVQVWYPSTVCTLSRECKKMILRYLEKTGDPSLINFKLHDFGFRGVSSVESAAIGGLAHLVNFRGGDTVPPLILAREYYDCRMAGFSIPASEHSTMTSWNQDGEVDAMRNMIKTYSDYPLYACVSDSYDIYRACREYWGGELKYDVLNGKGTLVIRPDSGTPHEVVLKCLDILGDKFGITINGKGYKVLHPKVRLIQGDGVDYFEIRNILAKMEVAGWSADNVAFGMGGGLLQKVNRDTQAFAFKASSIIVNGFQRDVFKQPITDSGKASKKGYQSLIIKDGMYKTINKRDMVDDILLEVYLNGKITWEYTLDGIRERADHDLSEMFNNYR